MFERAALVLDNKTLRVVTLCYLKLRLRKDPQWKEACGKVPKPTVELGSASKMGSQKEDR